MGEVNGQRCDIELMPQWGRRLRDGELDYANQLNLFNTLVIVREEFLKLCDHDRRLSTALMLLEGSLNELVRQGQEYEVMGEMNGRETYRIICDIGATREELRRHLWEDQA